MPTTALAPQEACDLANLRHVELFDSRPDKLATIELLAKHTVTIEGNNVKIGNDPPRAVILAVLAMQTRERETTLHHHGQQHYTAHYQRSGKVRLTVSFYRAGTKRRRKVRTVFI